MPRHTAEPATRPDPHGRGTVTEHPAFAQIQAMRVNGGACLYGSEFRHQNFITVSIHRSDLRRDLSRDWHYPGKEMIEIALSEAQWATFISTLNSGGGTPCTLQRLDGAMVPGLPPPKPRQEQFAGELGKTFGRAKDALAEVREQIAKSSLSGKAKEALARGLDTVEMNIDRNLDFVAGQFGEHMETVTEHAKIEVEAYAQATIQRAGLAAIAEAPITLPSLSAGDPAAD